jgi:cytoskeletal protein CcmA (bactofilin family)
MKIENYKLKINNSGQAALTAVIFFLIISIIIAFGFSSIAVRESNIARTNFEAKRSYFLAEAGQEDAIYRIVAGKNHSTEEILSIGGHAATTTITQVGSTWTITSEGDITTSIRRLKTTLADNSSVGISFNFGAHIGSGGLTMASNSEVNGNVHSNGNITGSSNTDIYGDASAVGIISSPNPDVSGTKTEGASSIPLPPIDLDFWRSQANINNDPIAGNYILGSGSDSFGPKKVAGDFTLDGNSQFTVTGALHVTGDLLMDSNSEMFLDEGFANNGTVIVVDGTITFESNADIHGTSASPKGYILFVTPSTSSVAIEVNSNSTLETGLYATAGTVKMGSNGDLVMITAETLNLESNASLNYDTGLANSIFTSGSQGGIQITDWREVE